MTTITQTSLTERWNRFKNEHPKKRIREAAAALGVSEVELLATEVGSGVVRLEGDFSELYKQLPTLGRVMSLTRNDACVLEHKGLFEKVNIHGEGHKVGTLIGSIEARAFFNVWKYAFAGEIKTAHGSMKNIQFFDTAGVAVTKIYLQEEGGNPDAYQKIVDTFRAEEQTGVIATTQDALPHYQEDIDADAFRADWRALKDTHEFFGMLRKFKVNRLRALEIAGGDYTRKIDKAQLIPMLENAATDQLPIMIFVGSKGNIQIHQDVISTVRVMDNWLNILDSNFNMHLNLDIITDTWVVKKPTSDGEVTSIECFDKNRELMVQFFGLRKPGKPELQEWKTLVKSL